MNSFFAENRPGWLRIVALLLVAYVAYLVFPVLVHKHSSSFQRIFAVVSLLFFGYLLTRSATVWEKFFSANSNRK